MVQGYPKTVANQMEVVIEVERKKFVGMVQGLPQSSRKPNGSWL